MTNSILNQAPYLRTSREFPEEIKMLALEINRTYVDIAQAVNNRTISLFPSNRQAITGNSYFVFQNKRQQSFRQVYTFTAKTAINHGIQIANVPYIASMYGQFTDGTNWYGLIPGSSTAIAGQISFYLTPTQIIFETGAGAPSLTSGIIIIEWLSQP